MYKHLSFNLSYEFLEDKKQYYKELERTNNDSTKSLQKFVLMRTYSRNKFSEHGDFIGNETFFEIVTRVINGVFSLLKDSLIDKTNEHGESKWNDEHYNKMAEEYFDLVYNFKITPPGRGFWTMGTEIVHKKKLGLPLVNCTFISSANIEKVRSGFFGYIADALMLGVGVGFDDRGADKIKLVKPEQANYRYNIDKYFTNKYDEHGMLTYVNIKDQVYSFIDQSVKADHEGIKFLEHEYNYIENKTLFQSNCNFINVYKIEDTREGWVKAMVMLVESYLEGGSEYITLFDYSDIRPKGKYLKTFGGTASGPLPLAEGLSIIRWLLERKLKKYTYRQEIESDLTKTENEIREISAKIDDSEYEFELLNEMLNSMKNLQSIAEKHNDVDVVENYNNSITALINVISKEVDGLTLLKTTRKSLYETENKLRSTLENGYVPYLDSLLIVDIANVIATIVVAGNVRRSSEIFLSKNLDAIKYKNYEDYPYRASWSWASNNSIIVDDTSADDLIDKIADNIVNSMSGEPGIFNQEIVKYYGRICDGLLVVDGKVVPRDPDANGTNPCGEISLSGCSNVGSLKEFSAGGETCNLVETYPANYDGSIDEVIDQYEKDLYFAMLYCKIVTTVNPHWKSTEDIQSKNRRIGISQTGIIPFISKHNLSIEDYGKICDRWYKTLKKYDEEISELLEIPRSIKITTVKPSGTTTLCSGLDASGMHASPGKYYLRRVRISNTKKDYLRTLRHKGYHIEDAKGQEGFTSVITFPCKAPEGCITKEDIDIEYQFELLACLQTWWSDNQVSCTITFKKSEEDKIASLLKKYKNVYKSLSLLPLDDHVYPQSPEEIISEDRYNIEIAKVKPVEYDELITKQFKEEIELDNYCSGDKCVLRPKSK